MNILCKKKTEVLLDENIHDPGNLLNVIVHVCLIT